MFSEDKVTEIFCLAGEFCKFLMRSKKNPCSKLRKRHRRKPNRMSDAEIIVILIHFHSGGFRCFKHYYLHYICKHCTNLFPKTVSYKRFVELEMEVLLQLTAFIKQVLLGECTGISFVDRPLCVYTATSAYLYTRHSMVLQVVANAQCGGFLDSNYT